jgi:hypothetical protein
MPSTVLEASVPVVALRAFGKAGAFGLVGVSEKFVVRAASPELL